MKLYNCLHCNKEVPWASNKINKFCSNTCQGLFKWVTDTRPQVLLGNKSDPKTLKKFLVQEIGEVCMECGQDDEWNGMPLVLQLDHIDGNSDNNFPSNLRLLCPNCHTQTTTYGSKGTGNTVRKETKRNEYLRNYKGN